MEYHEAAEYLESLRRHRPKLGTDTTAAMLSYLDRPQEELDFVQVAGSNGKGSTATMLDRVLRTADYDVGLFTSPGLNDFREQVTVNGQRMPKDRVVEFVERIQPCIEHLTSVDDEPTHFEVLTALAIYHHSVEDVDVSVLEVGIGGRYDATSAITPVASAVTSVSLEHTDLLGETVEEIARDKAQVAPPDRPLVTGTTGAALQAIRSETPVVTVGAEGADVVAVENGMDSDVESSISITAPGWKLESRLQLLGQHQAINAGVAAALARQVRGVPAAMIADGLRQATLPGRFEIIDDDPYVVLDGSHNPGATATLQRLLHRYDYRDLHVVFGAMSDKDHEGMVANLPRADTVYLTEPNLERAADVDTLARAFEGREDQLAREPSVAEAVDRAIANADGTDFVLVTGSLYAVAEARDRWSRLVVPKSRYRRSGDASLTGAAFPDTAPSDVSYRTLAVYLRPEQAARVAERLEAVGGECVRSASGAVGKFQVTVLSGTETQLRAFGDAIADDGIGLGSVARQVRAALDGSTYTEPFETNGTAVMGILNVTPDSFHDGGKYNRLEEAIERAETMVAAGADIVDVGGESTRPGAEPVSITEERSRVVPVVEALAGLDVPISVDTRKATVADAALEAGADIVNDVSGLSDPEMRFVVAEHDASLVLMHSLSAPVDPDRTGTYDDVVDDVRRELSEQILLAERAGIDREQIIVDPGCGFGKTAAESFELVDRLGEFHALGCPVMVGHSRKSMFEAVDVDSDRLAPTLATTAMAAERGADVVRVHDVAENTEVLGTVSAMWNS